MKNTTMSVLLLLFVSACSHKTESSANGTPQFQIAASDVSTVSYQGYTNAKAVVDVVFSRNKAAQLYKFTQEHLGQKVQILVGTNVLEEATIRSAIPNGEILLSYPTPKEAQSVVDSLTTK
jgi:preprotein translocase subunit SecD